MKQLKLQSLGVLLIAVPVLLYLSGVVWEVTGGTPNCVLQDNGSGTVFLPPVGCPYLSQADVHMLLAGLPPDTQIVSVGTHGDFTGVARTYHPGGSETETYNSTLTFNMTGTGRLDGFQDTVVIPNVMVQTLTGPRTAGAPVQVIDNDMKKIQGEITGTPNFSRLTVVAGSDFGMPSPGRTTLTELPSFGGPTMYDVDSYFDIRYSLDFEGAPGSPLENLAGISTGVVRMQSGITSPPEVPDGTFGTAMTVNKLDAAAATLALSWDRDTCVDATDHHIVYGLGAQLPTSFAGTYGVSGGECALGVTPPYTWTGVPDPSLDPKRLLWFLTVASDGSGNEGSWSPNSGDVERTGPGAGGSSAVCGITVKDLDNTCPGP